MEAEPPPIKVSGAWRVKPHSLGELYGLSDSVYPKTQVPKGSLQTRFVRWFMVVREGFLSTQNYLSKGSLWIAKWILVFSGVFCWVFNDLNLHIYLKNSLLAMESRVQIIHITQKAIGKTSCVQIDFVTMLEFYHSFLNFFFFFFYTLFS